MEPISYLKAPIRRWPVLIPVILVCLLVALLIPVKSKSVFPVPTWQASAQVGLTPQAKGNKLGAKLSVKQLEFYAHVPVVLAAAAQAEGVKVTKKLQNGVIVGKAKGSKQAAAALKVSGTGKGGKPPNLLVVAVLQPSKPKAVSMTNAFVASLGSYAQIQFAALSKQQLTNNQTYITNLEAALAALPPKTKVVKPVTTTTHKPAKIKRVVVKPPKTHTHHAATTTTSTTAAASSPIGSSTPAELTAFDQTATTPTGLVTPTSVVAPGVSPTPIPVPGVGVTTTTHPGSGSNQNKLVKEERAVLTNELSKALAHQALLKSTPTQQSGYKVIAAAKSSTAVQLNPKPSLLSHWWVRALLGLLVGLLLGILVTWLLDGLDRRIRTTKRAEEVFRLPVISEIPGPESKSQSVVPVVDIVVDPYSPISEAYRKLYVAILTAPTVTWVKKGGTIERWDPPQLAPPTRPLVAAAAATGDAPLGEAHYPVAMGSTELVTPRRERFSILVTSPNDEPSRSLAVVNLATVFAEAGDRVLVATTGGMRTEFEGENKGMRGWEGEMPDTDSAELVANARPSQIPGVSSLALGSVFPNPARLAQKAGGLIEAARDVVDVLLIEAPLLSTQDGAALLPVVDLVVVVCEAWHTTVHDGTRTQRLLTQRRPPVLGLVMTNMERDRSSQKGH